MKLKRKISEYKLSIVHVPGIQDIIADATSRYTTGFGNETHERLTLRIARVNRNTSDEQDDRETEELQQERTVSFCNIQGSGRVI